MNLEGKQQIWKDYQKEIADDKYGEENFYRYR